MYALAAGPPFHMKMGITIDTNLPYTMHRPCPVNYATIGPIEAFLQFIGAMCITARLELWIGYCIVINIHYNYNGYIIKLITD